MTQAIDIICIGWDDDGMMSSFRSFVRLFTVIILVVAGIVSVSDGHFEVANVRDNWRVLLTHYAGPAALLVVAALLAPALPLAGSVPSYNSFIVIITVISVEGCPLLDISSGFAKNRPVLRHPRPSHARDLTPSYNTL